MFTKCSSFFSSTIQILAFIAIHEEYQQSGRRAWNIFNDIVVWAAVKSFSYSRTQKMTFRLDFLWKNKLNWILIN